VFTQTPVPLHPDVAVELLTSAQSNSVRIDYEPNSEYLYYVRRNGNVYRLDRFSGNESIRFRSFDHGIPVPGGFAISGDSTFFLSGSINSGNNAVGYVKRAAPPNYNWVTVVQTEPYPRSGTDFDHWINGIAISPDGEYLFINSGSRTDHGEEQNRNGAFPGVREVPLTSAIFRVPADTQGVVLPANEQDLINSGFLYADGVRNSFDLAFGPEGDLFAAENSGERDDGDELNWIRQGHHYGFPWRMGTNDTPQQFPGWDPDLDPLVNPLSIAYTNGFFYDDSTYPAPPSGIDFTDPIINIGPDSDRYRSEITGDIIDASLSGDSTSSFTPHISPLGLNFDNDSLLTGEFSGGGFVLGWTGTATPVFEPFGDPGESLFLLQLQKNVVADRYEMSVTRLVENFLNPMDAVLVDNLLYVLEWNFVNQPRIWKVTLPTTQTSIEDPLSVPMQFRLEQNYPNPFNPSTVIRYAVPENSVVQISIYNVAGQKVRTLVNKRQHAAIYSVEWDGTNDQGIPVSSGIYVYRLTTSKSSVGTIARKMVLIR
ncbi:MAG: FlgD immunoglobulin-like domain containing protein, partial [Calditrichota bacterium]